MNTNSATKQDFDEIYDYYNGLAAARKGKLWGYVNEAQEEVIPFRFEKAGPMMDNLASVKLNGKYGVIDIRGNEIVPCKYSGVDTFSCGVIYAHDAAEAFFIDLSGKEIMPPIDIRHQNISIMGCKDCIVVKSRTLHIIIYADGYTPIKCDRIGFFREGLAAFMKGDKIGFIDTRGKDIIPLKYKIQRSNFSSIEFHDGYACLHLTTGHKVYVDKEGNEYDDIPNQE